MMAEGDRAWMENRFTDMVGVASGDLRDLAAWMEDRAAGISMVDGKSVTAVQLVTGMIARIMNALPNSGVTLLVHEAEKFDRAVSTGLFNAGDRHA